NDFCLPYLTDDLFCFKTLSSHNNTPFLIQVYNNTLYKSGSTFGGQVIISHRNKVMKLFPFHSNCYTNRHPYRLHNANFQQ
ncbi:MAG TPA: hypothetical protein QF468_02290, partial [Nitrospinota bacterium]|nr:hypothetical protein [Nitrospinota bacterium]